MTSIVYCDYCPSPYLIGSQVGSLGVSDESAKLNEKNNETQKRELLRAQESSYSRAFNAQKVLFELYVECHKENWNGRDALPIPSEAIFEAEQLIALIPEKYPMPEIIPEVTGEVGLEWFIDPYRVLLLSVAGDGYIYYSGLFGFKNTDHGSKPFAGKLDKKIISLLEEVYKDFEKE